MVDWRWLVVWKSSSFDDFHEPFLVLSSVCLFDADIDNQDQPIPQVEATLSGFASLTNPSQSVMTSSNTTTRAWPP